MSESTPTPQPVAPAGRPERVLNLQELYGEEPQPVTIVSPSGNRYHLRNRREFGPLEMVMMTKLQRQLNDLGPMSDEVEPSTEQAKQMQTLMNETIRMLSPELAAEGLCFMDQAAVIQFWTNQTNRTLAAAAPGDNPPVEAG